MKRKDLRRCDFKYPADSEWITRAYFHKWITVKVPHFIDAALVGGWGEEADGKIKRHYYTQETRALIEDKAGEMHQIELHLIKFSNK